MNSLLESQVYWRLIALAQSVPELDQVVLFDWISGALSGPLNSNSLEQQSVESLQASAPEALKALPAERWDTMLTCLHGELPTHLNPIPAMGGSEDALCAAFASSDGLTINGHFGNCTLFFIYQIQPTGSQLIDIRRYVAEPGTESNEGRAALLHGCHLLFCEAIGGPAAARVIRHGVHPIKTKRDNRIDHQLAALGDLMSGQLPPWLAKALGRKDDLGRRFSLTETELD